MDFPNRLEYEPPPLPELIDGNEFYRIEAFRKHRYVGRKKSLQFWVKWTGYGEDENQWKSAEQLQQDMQLEDYQQFLREYISRSRAKLAIQMVLAAVSDTAESVISVSVSFRLPSCFIFQVVSGRNTLS